MKTVSKHCKSLKLAEIHQNRLYNNYGYVKLSMSPLFQEEGTYIWHVSDELNVTKSFDQWMKKVDAIIEAKCGFSSADLPDCCYSDWYEDGMKPATAASKALKMAGE